MQLEEVNAIKGCAQFLIIANKMDGSTTAVSLATVFSYAAYIMYSDIVVLYIQCGMVEKGQRYCLHLKLMEIVLKMKYGGIN